MVEKLIPVLKVSDAKASAQWFARLGFEVTGQHQFEPNFPIYMFLDRQGIEIHLSEHEGDAPPKSLVYFWVDDVDAVAEEFGARISDEPWGREVDLVDPDGNRLRVATRAA